MNNTTLSRLSVAARWVLGLVFLFSGISKGIDPWGTALKINEYLDAFGLEFASAAAPFIAVTQCVVEALIGLLLIAGKCLKPASAVTALLLGFFTLLTLYIAIFNPLDDCGCFGNALKLNNWLTFAKNIVLLPVSIFVWRRYAARKSCECRSLWLILPAIAFTALFAACWYLMPSVGTLPYRTGTNLRSDILCSGCIDRSVVLVYQDLSDNSVHEFSLADTTWYDTSRWFYLKTLSAYDDVPDDIRRYDFSLWRGGANYASELVYDTGNSYMIILNDIADLTPARSKKITDFIDRLDSGNAILAIGSDSETDAPIETFETQKYTIPVYGIDREVAALLLRADAGIVKISDGVVAAKRHLARRNTLLK